MPQKDDCLRATRYICDLLENSGDYVIQRNDAHEAVVRETPILGRNQEQRTISVIIANSYSSVPAYLKKVADNAARGIYTAPVLYKDGKTKDKETNDEEAKDKETAFVLLTKGERGKKSLKKYDLEKRHQMICLRKWEKHLARTDASGRALSEVTYYQPESERLDESLRRFRFGEVDFDYSYVPRDELAKIHAKDGPSKEIKFPHETGVITGAVMFRFEEGLAARLVGTTISPLSSREVAEDLEDMARSYFPGLDEEMALAALSGEEL